MFWFLLNALVVLFFTWLVTKKYGTLLNPVGFFSGFYLMSATIAPMVYQNLGLFKNVSDDALRYASILSSVYFATIGLAFVVRSSPFKGVFEWLFRFIRPFELKDEGNWIASSGLLLQAAVLFILLMIANGGLMWITNPRLAYAMHRDSVGALWSASQAALLMAYICVIFRKARNMLSLFGIALCFAALAWFLGSKAYMLAYFILALFYAHIRIKKISNKTIVLAGVVILGGGLMLQLSQGTAQDVQDTFTYFDYFRNSALLLYRFKDFGFRYGAVTLSNLWYYVPRGIYHAKPYAYGLVVPDEFLYPGAAADGYTPGIMTWSLGYCDFGLAGVVLYGLFAGFFAKGAYELFLERRDIQSMVLFGQIGLIYWIEVFGNAPFLLFLIWLMFQLALIRILSSCRLFPVKLTLAAATRAARSSAGNHL